MTAKHRSGQVLTHDFQADVWGGQYTLVERIGPNRWIVTDLPPSETEIEEILTDPALTERVAQQILTSRWARWGERSEIRFVSPAEYARHF